MKVTLVLDGLRENVVVEHPVKILFLASLNETVKSIQRLYRIVEELRYKL